MINHHVVYFGLDGLDGLDGPPVVIGFLNLSRKLDTCDLIFEQCDKNI